MKWLYVIPTAVLVIAAAGCPKPVINPPQPPGPTGVTVSRDGASFNNPNVPPAFKSRAACTGLTAGYSPEDLVCNIVEVGPGAEPTVIGTVTPTSDYRCKLTLVKESGNYYHSRIQYGAQVLCSYLAFAADLKAGVMVDYALGDDAVASFGPLTEDICNKLSAWVAKHPRKDTSVRRLWIREIVRSQQTTATFDTVGASISAQVGPLVGVKGTVYRRNDNDTRAWIFGLVTYDVDLACAKAAGVKFVPANVEEIWEPCLYTRTIPGIIRK